MARRIKLFLTLLLMMIVVSTVCATTLKYGYDGLGDQEKVLYDRISDAIFHFGEGIDNPGFSPDECLRILNCFLADHPEVFWIDCSLEVICSKNKSNTTMTDAIMFMYSHLDDLEEEIKLFREKAEEIHSEVKKEANDWFKLLRIYETIASAVIYDTGFMDQTIWSTLVCKRGVCAGVARLFQYLAHLEGIPCILVYGNSIDDEGQISSDGHVWCMANVMGEWYHFDPTWAIEEDGDVDYAYFCRSDEKILKSHIINEECSAPKSGSDILSYVNVRKRVFDEYRRTEYSDTLMTSITRRENVFYVEFSSQSDLSKAVKDLIDDSGIFELLNGIGYSINSLEWYADWRNNGFCLKFPS